MICAQPQGETKEMRERERERRKEEEKLGPENGKQNSVPDGPRGGYYNPGLTSFFSSSCPPAVLSTPYLPTRSFTGSRSGAARRMFLLPVETDKTRGEPRLRARLVFLCPPEGERRQGRTPNRVSLCRLSLRRLSRGTP
jgi:hypothetical protein